uniref:uracil-DNA glycosylase n=1 Tax=Alkalibacillus aidingensis TaxID=2747607 RepID=UPI001660E8F9|nr:uracil-DNA glycosylase [Alkalibacillus aidingensis]
MELHTDWNSLLNDEIKSKWFRELEGSLKQLYQSKVIYPPYNQIFRALNLTSFKDTKVVILGQDPYHGEKQANGLSFSVNQGTKIPPSLKNIYKELAEDIGCDIPEHGDLTHWATEGVLLLNTILTVEDGKPNSHKLLGWEELTNQIIELLSNYKDHVVFILWGKQALEKQKFIDQTRHTIIHGPHPSPLSAYRGFFGSKPFSQTNHNLIQNGQEPINWCI